MTLRLAVAITGDAAGLKEGLDQAGRGINELAAKGEAAARRLADGLDRAGKRMQAIGQRLSLAVTTPLVAAAGVMVHAYDTQIQAEQRLAAAIRSAGEDAAAELKVYKDFAATLQSITTVGDEANEG